MRFEARIYRLSKDPAASTEYQDAYRMDALRGVASVADGVSASLFSGPWASILTDAVVANPPDPDDPEHFAAWLAGLRSAWVDRIDVSNLAWFQKAKLKQGAFATLIWLCLFSPSEVGEAPDDPEAAYYFQAFAVGDSCLFHLRDGALLHSFPIQTAAELDANPLALGSIDLNHDHLIRFARLDAWCRAGDVLALCTDAMADWVLRQYESGTPPDWRRLWGLTEAEWQAEVLDLRVAQQMRYDDTTLLLMRVKAEQAAALQPAPAAPPVSFLGLPNASSPPGEPSQPAAASGNSAPVVDWPSASPLSEIQGQESKGWRVAEQIVAKSEEIAEQVTDEVLRGVRKWKDRLFQRYREKFGRKDQSED